MRAIYCVLLSYTLLYFAAHTKRNYKKLIGFYLFTAWMSLIASIVFAILGL